MTKPIRPDQVAAAKVQSFPVFVFEAFNEQIASQFDGGSAVIKQDDVVRVIVERSGGSRQEVFDKGWLNVEDAYRAEGWSVSYDKPAWNESGDATFTFRAKAERA